MKDELNVLIVGAGLVGTLSAIMLAQRGCQVTLVESRSDPRLVASTSRARSINLALSARGIQAINSVNPQLAQLVMANGIAMRGRMIHKKPNNTTTISSSSSSSSSNPIKSKQRVDKLAQDYGFVEEGEVIRSISRTELGIHLLNHVDNTPVLKQSIETLFDTKLIELDLRLDAGINATLGNRHKGQYTRHFDLVIGADGAYSRVRREMMRGSGTRFNYKQYWAPHAYLELSIPAGPASTFQLEPNYLHIWPRGELMLIALPNQDKTFTVTLFAHQTTFDALDKRLARNGTSTNAVIELFKSEFPDALELIGEHNLLTDWKQNPKDGLITVECAPYHFSNKALLIGDAAHAMVPFYGQGMNCGFEDVRFLSSLLDTYLAIPKPQTPSPLPYSSASPSLPSIPSIESTTLLERLELALSTYTLLRTRSITAIQQLAQSNYTEMASSVIDPLYLIRLSLDSLLTSLARKGWFSLLRDNKIGYDNTLGQGGIWDSLYRMTTFKWGIAYDEVIKRRQWQQKVLTTGLGIGLSSVGVVSWIVGRYVVGSGR
ncbi:kynurenine 3-monooxygenase, mitochondrial precursor [Microbotryomycetes sp. JL221]|nr:kynurenine 3-monooxygenase, mitochondrial precursor [Microbotryomycetes sp. JL221]